MSKYHSHIEEGLLSSIVNQIAPVPLIADHGSCKIELLPNDNPNVIDASIVTVGSAYPIGPSLFSIDMIDGLYMVSEENGDAASYNKGINELYFYMGDKVRDENSEEGSSYKYPTNLRASWAVIRAIDAWIAYMRTAAYLRVSLLYAYAAPRDVMPKHFAKRMSDLYYSGFYRLGGSAKGVNGITHMNVLNTLCGLPVTNTEHLKTAFLDDCSKAIGEKLYPQAYNAHSILHPTAVGIEKFKKKFDKYFSSTLHLQNVGTVGGEPEYATVVHPSYMDDHSLLVFVQTGYSEKQYIPELDNRAFFLTIDPILFTCKYSENFPWVEEGKDLFSLEPGVPDELVAKSALILVVDRLFSDIIAGEFSLYNELYTVLPSASGLRTDATTVDKFMRYLKDMIIKNYSPTKKDVNALKDAGDWYEWMNFDDGITVFRIGSVYLAVALGGFGVIDIAVDHQIQKKETWDDIIYTGSTTISKPLSEIGTDFDNVDGLLRFEQCNTTEGEVLLSEFTKMITSVMYRMEEERE